MRLSVLQILIDGVDVRSIDTAYFRSNVALVSQEPRLFNLSIADNITYGMSRDVTHVGDHLCSCIELMLPG